MPSHDRPVQREAVPTRTLSLFPEDKDHAVFPGLYLFLPSWEEGITACP